MEKLNETQQFKNYQEMTKNSEAFKKGVQDFKEGKVIKPSASIKWIKQTVSKREWDNYYKYNNLYCHLGEEGIGRSKLVKIGFCVADIIPEGCEELTDEEARQIDEYRRAYNLYPRVLNETFLSAI